MTSSRDYTSISDLDALRIVRDCALREFMQLQDRVDDGDKFADEQQAGLSKAIDRINGLIHKANGFEPTV